MSTFTFYNPQVNLYVKDVAESVQFYINNFGFIETFRTPKSGNPVHVELKLDQFILGLALISAAEDMHGLKVGTGLPKCEIVVWTQDVDIAYKALLEKGVPSISEPHTFLNTLRSAWIADPDGNLVQIVSKIE
ncbi:MAG: VOC family protein [Candidatus Thorarchaeota archaeon]